MEKKDHISKYNAQIKHLRNNYKRLTIDFRIPDLQQFKEICKKNNSTPTTEIKKFVNYFISHNGKLPF